MECCRIISPLASGVRLNINTSEVDNLAASLILAHFRLLIQVEFVLTPQAESHTSRRYDVNNELMINQLSMKKVIF